MAERRLIEKITYKRKEKTLGLKYKQLNDAGKWDRLTLETNDPPDPDFIAAMDELKAAGVVSKADAAGNHSVIKSTAPDGSGYSLFFARFDAEVVDD